MHGGVMSGSLMVVLAHGGSYSIYYALAVASNEIALDHRYVMKITDARA